MITRLNQNQAVHFADDTWNISFNSTANGRDEPLLSIKNHGKPIIDVRCKDVILCATILFDARETPVTLTGEVPAEGAAVLICNTQNRIALYVNGKLMDEDWPLGKVLLDNSFCDICDHCENAMIHDDFSVNNRYLSNQDFPIIQDIKSWTPEGHNTSIGDCMPFYHNGVYHLFYLFDRRGHQSKWGFGAHQWAHMSTTDFIHFKQYPMAITIDEQHEGSICTGSTVFFKKHYYAFYAVRQCDHSPASISYAISKDGITFKKTDMKFTLTAPYHGPSARDPMVFVDENNIANMLVTTSFVDENGGQRGCLARLTSKDLVHWQQEEPFVVLDMADQPECSDYFYWNGFYYLIYSNFSYAKYFVSETPYGPWRAPENNAICHAMGLRVPKTGAFHDGRRIAAGFVNTAEYGDYGGRLCFMELLQQSDGSLQFVTPKELV